MPLAIVDKQSLSRQTIEEIDKQVVDLIERHKTNRNEINRLVFEGTAALTAGNKLSQDMNSQGKLKRFWKRFSGGNSQTQKEINADILKAQYAAQQTLQKLADQQLLGFELIAAVNNKLNASMLEVNATVNSIYGTLLTFFRNARAEIVQLETRLKDVEQNVNLLNWQNSIEYQMYNGVEYQDLDDETKIICLVKDFYDITGGTWRTTDLLLMKTAMATIGLNPRDKVSVKNFVCNISSNAQLYAKLLGDNAQFATEEERIAFALRAAEQSADKEFTDMAVPAYEFVLELLCDLRQLEYNKTIHNKLQEAKKLFLSNKIKEALPLLQETADAGKDEARYMLATIYSKGLAVEKKPEYAALLTAGTIVEENPDALKKAADDGDVFSQYELAQYHLKEAEKYLKQSADQNYFLAAYKLGLMYFEGIVVEKDYVKAKEYFEIGADRGYHGLSMIYLADIYFELYGTNVVGYFKSSLKTIEYYEKARINGICLSDKQFEQLKIAAERIRGCSDLRMYYKSRYDTNIGRIVYYYLPRNQKEALKWALLGESIRDRSSVFYAGLIYQNSYKNSEIDTNYETAIKYFKRAIEFGSNSGLEECCIAELYEKGGYGIIANRSTAREWYKKAAAKGDSDAKKWLERNPY